MAIVGCTHRWPEPSQPGDKTMCPTAAYMADPYTQQHICGNTVRTPGELGSRSASDRAALKKACEAKHGEHKCANQGCTATTKG